MTIHYIDGGVCAPHGFLAAGVSAGIKNNTDKEDLALIYSSAPCNVGAVFTQNIVKAEPVKFSQQNIADAKAHNFRAIIVNSGNANACTGEQGREACVQMVQKTAECFFTKNNESITKNELLVCSTGVIGKQIPIDRITQHIPRLVSALSKQGNIFARKAIMTTDTVFKECACEIQIGGVPVKIGTMAKGSGMIHINMGTMLGFITTDCAISPELLQRALSESVKHTYNCVSVDGDSSTNDSLLMLANGKAGNPLIEHADDNYNIFLKALIEINTQMAKKIAADGEGAEHFIECYVFGAKDDETARILGKSVVSSNLVKAAIFGKDANWGRIICALGYAGVFFDQKAVSVFFESKNGKICVFEQGQPLDFDEQKAEQILSAFEIKIIVEMHDADGAGYAWGCDLTYEYVKINGDYRT